MKGVRLPAILIVGVTTILALSAFSTSIQKRRLTAPFDEQILGNAQRLIEEGRETFRYDTFGDEEFWGTLLRLHEAIENVSPRTALGVGLKVDSDALPKAILEAIRQGRVDLDDPAVTLELLRLNAVVGVKGFFTGQRLSSIGIQCALCHSTVDNRIAPGIGKRLDGWANRDLNVGAIVSLAPNLQPFADLLGVEVDTVRRVLASWGPGKFDAELILDGKAFRPDGGSAATLLPPAFGLAGVNLHTWTGWGSVTHWNAFVANLEMHGKGTFYDPRLENADQFPIAARENFGNVRNDPDLITGKLAALHAYQLAIPAPRPPDGFFDPAAAAEGEALFNGRARCATCHVPPLFTEPGWNMHTPGEIGIDAFQADRSPDRRYRTAPLKGLWTHTRGGFYHDGRFATLRDVLDHYDTHFSLGLSDSEKHALEEYLKSLGDAPVPGFVLPGVGLGSLGSAEAEDGGVRLSIGNPARGSWTLELDLDRTATVEVRVFDLQGREVGLVAPERTLEPGRHALAWDGRGARGTPIRPGVYFVRAKVGNERIGRTVSWLGD